MKKLITTLLILVPLLLLGQQTETPVGKSVPNTSIISTHFPLVKSKKLDTTKLIDAADYLPSIPPSSTWTSMIKCIMEAEDISCEDIDCTGKIIAAGTWKVMLFAGMRNGLYSYWAQGQSEPLLGYNNGIVQIHLPTGLVTVQVWQLVGSEFPLTIGQEFKFSTL